MNRSYVIAMDVHSDSCHGVVVSPSGRKRADRTVPTSIPALREVVQATPRPRRAVFEEGSLAGWLYRHLLAEYDQAVEHEPQVKEEMIRRARKIRVIRHLTDLPGVRWIRAATFSALIDTPFRFRSQSALWRWRYMGIGLPRRSSGPGLERVQVTRTCNRTLKNIILGAAINAHPANHEREP